MRDTRNIRAWDDVAKHMSYGKAVQYDDMLGYRFEHFETETPIYMWSTGLKDLNGKEIYEGDQLFASGNLTEDLQYVGDVEWDEEDARWEVVNFHGRFEWIPDGCVVQGNIYEAIQGEDTQP